jgi:protein transport protein SEC20
LSVLGESAADLGSEDDALQTKTNEVTDALRRTTTLMQTELERSVLSVQMLGEC